MFDHVKMRFGEGGQFGTDFIMFAYLTIQNEFDLKEMIIYCYFREFFHSSIVPATRYIVSLIHACRK